MRQDFPSQFSSPDESAGFLLWQVTTVWQRQLNAMLKPLGLTHIQFVLLTTTAWLRSGKEPVTQVVLSKQTKIQEMLISQVIRRLVSKGLMQRVEHPTDTRAKAISLTKKGAAIVQKAIPQVEKADNDFFQLDKRNLHQFINVLQELAQKKEKRI